MTSARPIALWLVAAIVAIAASLIPCGAQAHGDHRPAPRAQAVPAAAPDIMTTGDLVAAARFSIFLTAVPKGSVSEAGPVTRASLDCSAGGACGHPPSSCCAAALVPSPLPGLPPLAARDRARAGDAPLLSGIVPDTQVEPPRRGA
ncbi:hypothetical protein MPPM_3125 [Methylorubrum populi]|uniref:Uncharacterized protein n=1 Tax=Methylorubrum populi TaxID=223967 RepID=A0A160PJ24_9HYPH|nr:hypothetical protein MPPM_3125 [Methylorubrum populi]